jgi:type II secretory pathway component PulF
LEEAAKNAILLYEEEFNKIVDNLSKVIEPILILFV